MGTLPKALFIIILTTVSLCSTVLQADAPPSPYAVDRFVVGKKAPEFTLKDLNGKDVSLSSFIGTPILIFFWASWCPTAAEEISSLNRLQKLYGESSLRIISVSTDKSASTARAFLAKNPAFFLTLSDENLYVSKTLYKVFMIPMTFFVDRGGVVVKKKFGQQNWTEPNMIKEIEDFLAESRPKKID